MTPFRTRSLPGVTHRGLVVGVGCLSVRCLLVGVPWSSSQTPSCPQPRCEGLWCSSPPSGGPRDGHVT